MALYSLYRRVRTAPGAQLRYERMAGAGAYPKANAVRIFQSLLLGSALGDTSDALSLRVVPAVKASPLPASERMCAYCSTQLHTQCSKGSCGCNCRAITG